MTAISSKSVKLNERIKSTVLKPKLNCLDFSQSTTADLKQMDNFVFVEYLGQRHSFPQRLSSARQKDVSSLKVTYFTEDHVNYMQQTADNLQKLDLSNSVLFKLPYGIICNMHQLQILILDHNQLTESSFCKEFCLTLCNSLKELSICSNSLSLWPESIDNLNKLTRLILKENSISSLKGIEKFKRLKMLNVEKNQLTQLGNNFYLIKRLEYLYASHNQLTTVSTFIKHLNYLREIDLSFNLLKTVPGDIFLLENLEILKLNDNQITKLPKFKISGKSRKNLTLVDLSFNHIASFPECIMKITEELDLSNNKLRIIPPNVFKKFPYATSQKLFLANNPLLSPPKEICESGLKSMIQFYLEMETVTKSNYGLKIFCVGSEQICKSRIITSLTDQNEDDGFVSEREHILEIFDTTFELPENCKAISKLLNLQFIDIITENNDTTWMTLFLTFSSMTLFFVDVDNYSKESFKETVGTWLRQIIFKQNEISLMLVGITNMKTNYNQTDILDTIKSDIMNFIKDYLGQINNEINYIESQTKINASMSLILKRFIYLKSMKFLFNGKCVLIETKNSKTYTKLHDEILNIISKSNNFKNVLSSVPSFWSDVQLYFEEEGHNFPVISLNDYEILIQQKFNLKPSALKIANFLHETGHILWWENAPSPLNQWIVPYPYSLVECLKTLFRSDLKTYLEDPSDPDRIYKRFKKRFLKSKYTYKECINTLFHKSLLLPELLTILWENILPLSYINRMLYYLCECWSMGYIINFPHYPQMSWKDSIKEINEIQVETISSVDSGEYRSKSAESIKSNKSSQNKVPPVFLPRFLTRNECLEQVNQKWSSVNCYRICVLFKFKLGIPKIVSEQILVRVVNNKKLKIQLMDHWIKGIQAEIESANILFRICHYTEQDEHLTKYEFRHTQGSTEIDYHSGEARNYSTIIWEIMSNYLSDTEELMDSYKGLWYERLVKCPYCDEASFPGTWNASNDSSPNEDQICDCCNKLVPSHMLFSPKLSKVVSSDEVIKNLRRHHNRG